MPARIQSTLMTLYVYRKLKVISEGFGTAADA
jgi:hypothetical protein